MIRKLFDFRLLEPLKADLAKRDHNRKCAYHKEHKHTTEQCRSLHYLVEKLIRAGHQSSMSTQEPGMEKLLEIRPL